MALIINGNGMKAINNTALRVVFALVLGFVLILWPAKAINYLVITIGILFLLPGLVSVLAHVFRDKQHPKGIYPIEGIGSCLLGLALICAPGFFVGALMYVLAAALIFASVIQIRGLFMVRKRIRIPVGFYLVSLVVLLAGTVILFNPFTVVETTFIILGITCIIYSASELFNYLKFLKSLD